MKKFSVTRVEKNWVEGDCEAWYDKKKFIKQKKLENAKIYNIHTRVKANQFSKSRNRTYQVSVFKTQFSNSV